MLERLLKMGYHTACALLDCKRYALLNKCFFIHLPKLSIELLIDKVYGLKDRALNLTLKRLTVYIMKALDLLKSWVERMADKPYTKMAWELAQDANENIPLNYYYYFAPLETLEWLISGQEISVLTVQERLGKLYGSQWGRRENRDEVRILDMVMFWEAPRT